MTFPRVSCLLLVTFFAAVSTQPAFAQLVVDDSGDVLIESSLRGNSDRLNVDGRVVLNAKNFRALEVKNTDTLRTHGRMYGMSAAVRGSKNARAISAYARPSGSGHAIAATFEADGGRTGADSWGIKVYAENGASNRAIYARTRQDADGDPSNDYAGYFAGDVHITGSLSGVSDRKFKRNIRSLGRGLSGKVAERVRSNAARETGAGAVADVQATSSSGSRSVARAKLLRLSPKRFEYRTSEYNGMSLPKGEQIGLIAQELRQVFPAMVEEVHVPAEEVLDDEGNLVERTPAREYLSVNHTELIPILIQAVHEQQAEIDALRESQAKFDALRQRIRALEGN